MNLSDLVGLIKKSYLYLIVGLILIVGVTLIYVYLDNPKGEQGFGKLNRLKINSTVSDKLKISSELGFSGNFLKLINIYKYEGNINPYELTTKLGIVGEPKVIKDLTYWISQTRNFSYSNSKGSFTYELISNIGSKSIDENQAFEKANIKLKELNLISADVTAEKIKVSFLEANPYHVEETNAANFNMYAIEIGAKIDGIRIVDSQGSGTLYRFYIGVDGEIRKIEGYLKKLSFSEKSTYPVKHLSTVQDEVAQGKSTVVNISSRVNPALGLKINYHKGELVYYLTSQPEEYLQPVFLMISSNVIGNDGIFGVISAVKDESYK